MLLFVLVIFGVNSCQTSARNSALTDYNSSLTAVIQQSNTTGRQVFVALLSGESANNLYTTLNQAHDNATSELSRARGFGVPDEVKQAHQSLLLALQMRSDAIGNIAGNINQALGTTTSKDAITTIAAEMARFYASDVLYKDYVLPFALGALHSAGISIGGSNGQQFEPGQFLADVRWLDPTFVAGQLHVTYQSSSSTSSGPVAPGPHGHKLDSVAVSGTTLQSGATLTGNPAPTFTLTVTNTGANTETNVVCQVTATPTSGSGTAVSGQTTLPQTTAGQQTSCDVTPSSAISAGSYTVSATIQRVPGEKNVARNTQTFTVTFQ